MAINDVKDPSISAVSITSASPVTNPCRAVYIGTSADYDFTLNGVDWVKFQGCFAGSILPLQAYGARKNAGGAAPTAGDVVFLY